MFSEGAAANRTLFFMTKVHSLRGTG